MARVRIDDTVVPMRDGVGLAADVVCADDGLEHPVLLARTPYSRQSLREGYDPIGHARRGWAVVLQDVRGRFDSEGDFAPFHQEVADGADTVAWCAAQPWSDGRVAMMGGSYNGATQWLAAVGRPPALKALSPLITATDFRDEWFHQGGAPELAFPASWALSMAASRPRITKAAVRRLLRLVEDWPALLRDPDAATVVASAFGDHALWADRNDRAYWQPIDVSRTFQRIDVPAWHLAGWYDVFCEGTLSAYVGMATSAASAYARRSQRLVVGPWTHTNVYLPATAEVDFGLHANGTVAGLPAEMLEFLADAVAGREVKAGVTVFVMGQNRWRDLETWPPPSTPLVLNLSAEHGAHGLAGDGHLDRHVPAPGRDRWRHDPADPVPNRGGRTLLPVLPMPGPMDQRTVQQRGDVMVYTTEPLPNDVTVIGAVTAHLVVASTGAAADVTVKLCDVERDGRAVNIVDSIRRSPFTSRRPRGVEVAVGSTAHRFRRGHRIRVEVASSNFPRFACLPASEQTVLYGSTRPSAVTLPVVK